MPNSPSPYAPAVDGFDNLLAAIVTNQRARRQDRERDAERSSAREDRKLDREMTMQDRKDRLEAAIQDRQDRIDQMEKDRASREKLAGIKTDDKQEFIPREVLGYVTEQADRDAMAAGELVQDFGETKPRIAPGKADAYRKRIADAISATGHDPATLRRIKTTEALSIPGPFNVHAPEDAATAGPPAAAPSLGSATRSQIDEAMMARGNPPYGDAPAALPPAEPAPIPRAAVPVRTAPPAAKTTGYEDPRPGLFTWGSSRIPGASEWNASQDASIAKNPPPKQDLSLLPKAEQFRQFSGLDPAPQFLERLVGGDDAARAATLRAMTPGERLQAIAALKKMGYR